jgi:acetyl-CoA acetyltransferase
MREVAVLGVGLHPWGKFDKPVVQMDVEATLSALSDAGMEWRDMQAVCAGSSNFSGGLGWGLAANELMETLGFTGIPAVNVSAACATGGSAIAAASNMIANGVCDVALVVAGEKMPTGFIPRTPAGLHVKDPGDVDYLRWAAVGMPNTGSWAMLAHRRMHDFGTTEETLARISVKAHKIGVHNPYARFRKTFTLDDVLHSPMVSSPLRLYEICAVSDGAAAAVLGTMDIARRMTTKPIKIAACSLGTARYGDPEAINPCISTNPRADVSYISESTSAVYKAYERAGVAPKDIDFVELQDNSTIHELIFPELWGLCEPGESDRLVDKGETDIHGKLPINPSGGFQSFGEATTAMGLFHLAHAVWQLRGESGPRQVENAKVGLCCAIGLLGNGAATILTI